MEPTTATNSQQTQKQIVDRVNKLRQQYEQSTVDARKEYQDIYNAYMGRMDSVENTPYESKETIPKLRTEVSYVKPFIYSGEPEIEVEGVGDEDQTVAKLYEKIINFRFKTIPNFAEKIEAWVSQSVTFGTSHALLRWRFETKEGEDGVRIPVKDEPDIEIPSQLDIFYNPLIVDAKDQPCFILRSVLPIDQVKQNPAYDYVGEDGTLNREKVMASGTETSNYNSSSLISTDIPGAQKKATEDMCEIYELIDNDRIQTICGEIVLRDVANVYGFKPIVKLIHEPNAIPNRADGLGVGQDTLGLGKMFYKLFNQSLTNVKLVNNPMFMFQKGLGIDARQLVAKPGGGIAVDTDGKPLSECIQALQFPDIKQGTIEIITKIDDEHKRASGANDLVQGSASNDTLGQDQLAQANTSNRFELIARRFKNALADMADMILTMEMQNLQSPEASVLRIFPEETRQQIFEILIASRENTKYDVCVKGETAIARNKNLESKRLTDLFNLAQNFLTDREKRAFLRKIAERQGEQNIDEIIMEANPIADQQEQMMGMEGQMPQQGMMGNSTANQYDQTA